MYGKGVGSSKKDAKMLAAKATLEILIPELNGNAEEICNINYKKPGSADNVMDSNNVRSVSYYISQNHSFSF